MNPNLTRVLSQLAHAIALILYTDLEPPAVLQASNMNTHYWQIFQREFLRYAAMYRKEDNEQESPTL